MTSDAPSTSAGRAPRSAVVTGASSGIGRATVQALTARGWSVLATARRADRLDALAAETGAEVLPADLTSADDVARLAATVAEGEPVSALVQVAGGALGLDSVEAGSDDDWARMYDINVLATKRLVSALLPELRRGAVATGFADLLAVTSTAAFMPYEGGGGYNAAKAAQRSLLQVLRLELNGEPIRVVEIAPGMVRTDEFSLVRFGGDAERAEAVYAGVEHPLTTDDVALAIATALELPGHINVDSMTVKPVAQATQTKVARQPLEVRGA